MGNQIFVDKQPLPLSEMLVACSTVGDKVARPKENFPNYLFVWKFEMDRSLGFATTGIPVQFEQFKSFSPECSYLIMRLYKKDITDEMKIDAEIEPYGSILESVSEVVTPRGLGTIFSATTEGKAKMSNMLYQIYVWNGNQSHRLVKAAVLANAYKIEKTLQKAETIKFLTAYPEYF
jgi:hypothetical protein